MQREKNDRSMGTALANVTWKTMDLVFGPIRDSVAMARRLMEGRTDGGARSESASDEPEVTSEDDTDDAPPTSEAKAPARDAETPEAFEDVWGVGAARAPKLREQGLTSLRELAEADIATLTTLPGVGENTAEKIKQSAAAMIE